MRVVKATRSDSRQHGDEGNSRSVSKTSGESLSDLGSLRVDPESPFLKIWNAKADLRAYTKKCYDSGVELGLPPVLTSQTAGVSESWDLHVAGGYCSHPS